MYNMYVNTPNMRVVSSDGREKLRYWSDGLEHWGDRDAFNEDALNSQTLTALAAATAT